MRFSLQSINPDRLFEAGSFKRIVFQTLSLQLVITIPLFWVTTVMVLPENAARLEYLNSRSLLRTFYDVLILAPIFETAFCQFYPVRILRSLGFHDRNQLFVAVLVAFMVPHFIVNGVGNGIVAGIGGGIVLGRLYVVASEKDQLRGFLLTAAAHCAWNLIPFTVGWVSRL